MIGYITVREYICDWRRYTPANIDHIYIARRRYIEYMTLAVL